MRLCIIIPTFKRREAVHRALVSLIHQSLDPRDYEVIVSIDGSDDGTREMVESLQTPYTLRAVWRPHGGRAAACNAGVLATESDLVLLLDDDMEASPGLVAAHVEAHSNGDQDLAVLGGVPVRLGPGSSRVARYIGTKFGRHLTTLSQPGYRVQLRDFYTGNCSMRRDTLLRAGLFDEDFTIYGNEDLELWVRLTRAGVQIVYSAEAVAYQTYGKTFQQLAFDNRDKGRTAVILARKHPEVLSTLKLSGYESELPRWRHVRTALLALSDRWRKLPYLLACLLGAADEAGLHLSYTAYALVLDYFYWLGAREELRHAPEVIAKLRQTVEPRARVAR